MSVLALEAMAVNAATANYQPCDDPHGPDDVLCALDLACGLILSNSFGLWSQMSLSSLL